MKKIILLLVIFISFNTLSMEHSIKSAKSIGETEEGSSYLAPFDFLPYEMLVEILSHLPEEYFFKCALVDRRWAHAISTITSIFTDNEKELVKNFWIPLNKLVHSTEPLGEQLHKYQSKLEEFNNIYQSLRKDLQLALFHKFSRTGTIWYNVWQPNDQLSFSTHPILLGIAKNLFLKSKY